MRIFTRDNMRWIDVADDTQVGDVVEWFDGEHVYRIVSSEVPGGLSCVQLREVETSNIRREVMSDENKTVAQLTAEYNAVAASKGKATVVKFRDLATAKRRLEEIRAGAKAVPSPASEKAPEKLEVKEKSSSTERENIIQQFSFRKGSDRERLLGLLIDRLGSQVPRTVLGKLAGSISGIEWRIDDQKIPFEVKTVKGEEVSYGLYRKVHPQRG
jgi:hypothetical protein